jgi:septum formation topological specificity factor MinE
MWLGVVMGLGDREATLEHAVLAQLKRPYKEFAEAIQKHMKLRKEHLQQQMQGWVEEAEADEVRDHARRLEQLQRQILAILANL